MYENYELKKFGADKIVFLGMFIISLFIAWLIVSINSTLVFSSPIELAHTGFSVCMPTGKDWQSDEKWQYEDNVFVLSSNFLVEQKLPAVAVTCRYFLTSQNINPRYWLDLQTQDLNNAIVEKGEIQKGNLTIHWSHAEKPLTMYWASAELPNNRTIDIEVIQTTVEIDLAWKVFNQVLEKLKFSEDNPVKNGTEIVNQIKSKGIDTLIDDHSKQVCFLIEDSSGYNVGFTIDLLGMPSTDDQNEVRGASQLLFTGRNSQRQYTFFRGDKRLKTYTWQSQTISREGRVDTQIILNQTGSINVTTQVNNYPRESNYINCYDIVPSILFELIISQFVRDNYNEAVVDVIESSGRVTPALISIEPVAEDEVNISSVIKLEFLDGRDYSQILYLDEDDHLLKEVMNYEQVYKLEKTDINSIKQAFPGQADNIIQPNLL